MLVWLCDERDQKEVTKKLLSKFATNKPKKPLKKMTKKEKVTNAVNLAVFGGFLWWSFVSFKLHDWFWAVVLLATAALWCNKEVLGDWPDPDAVEDDDDDNNKTQDLRRKWKES